MLREFKEFISRGNLVELAVAVSLGLAFAAVVSAFTEGIIGASSA
jgi:large conductance mechanosensitive channel